MVHELVSTRKRALEETLSSNPALWDAERGDLRVDITNGSKTGSNYSSSNQHYIQFKWDDVESTQDGSTPGTVYLPWGNSSDSVHIHAD